MELYRKKIHSTWNGIVIVSGTKIQLCCAWYSLFHGLGKPFLSSFLRFWENRGCQELLWESRCNYYYLYIDSGCWPCCLKSQSLFKLWFDSRQLSILKERYSMRQLYNLKYFCVKSHQINIMRTVCLVLWVYLYWTLIKWIWCKVLSSFIWRGALSSQMWWGLGPARLHNQRRTIPLL